MNEYANAIYLPADGFVFMAIMPWVYEFMV